MTDRTGNRRAYEARREQRYGEAADYFTQWGYESLAEDAVREGYDTPIARGLNGLLRASLNYYRSNQIDRAQNRAYQGRLVAEDLREHMIEEEKRRAILLEFIADFQTLAGDSDAVQSYSRALDAYEDANISYTISAHSIRIADEIIGFSITIEAEWDDSVDEELEIIYDFAGRVAFKRDNMKEVLENIGE